MTSARRRQDVASRPAPRILADAEVYLTVEEFCASFHVAPRTAQRWRVTGDGPPFVRIGKRRVGYRLDDCKAWAKRQTFAHRAEEVARATSPSA